MPHRNRAWPNLPALVTTLIIVVSGPGMGAMSIVDNNAIKAYPDHDPIVIRSNAAFAVPDEVSSNGVRGGTGTAADPYIIEDWNILYEPGQPAIWLIDTSAHVVVRNITFAEEWSDPGGFSAVQSSNAENIVVENLAWRGELAASVFDSRGIVLRDLGVPEGGTISLKSSDEVLVEDVRLEGRFAKIEVWQGDVTLRDVRVERSGSAQGSDPPPHVYLGQGEAESHPSCRLRLDNVSLTFEVENEFDTNADAGVFVEDGCSATLHHVIIDGTEAGVIATDNSNVDVDDVTLRPYYRPTSRSNSTQRPTYDPPVGIGLYGSIARLRSVTIDGFPTGIGLHSAASAPSSEWTSSGTGNDRDNRPPMRPSIDGLRTTIKNNGIGVNVTTRCDPCRIAESTIFDNVDVDLSNSGPSTFDARHNWWGSPDGPAPGSVQGDVLVEPWLTEGPPPPGDENGPTLPLTEATLFAIAALAVAALLHLCARRHPTRPKDNP